MGRSRLGRLAGRATLANRGSTTRPPGARLCSVAVIDARVLQMFDRSACLHFAEECTAASPMGPVFFIDPAPALQCVSKYNWLSSRCSTLPTVPAATAWTHRCGQRWRSCLPSQSSRLTCCSCRQAVQHVPLGTLF